MTTWTRRIGFEMSSTISDAGMLGVVWRLSRLVDEWVESMRSGQGMRLHMRHRAQWGVSLIEVLIGILIVVIASIGTLMCFADGWAA